MSSPCHDDPVLQALATLPPVLPDEARAQQLRARCRGLLERPPRQKPFILEPATVAALSAMYAWQIVRTLLVR